MCLQMHIEIAFGLCLLGLSWFRVDT